MIKALRTVGKYIMLMGRVFARPERMRMFFRQYINEIEQLGVNSIGIVLLISFFIGAVITIQIKLNIESPFMPRWTVGVRHPRNHVTGVFFFHHVPDIGRQSGLQYSFRTRNNAGYPANRCP